MIQKKVGKEKQRKKQMRQTENKNKMIDLNLTISMIKV